MNASPPRKPTPPRQAKARGASELTQAVKPGSAAAAGRRKLSAEAEQTLKAIRAGQIDALVIRSDDSEKLYALRSFVEIEQTQTALREAGAEGKRTRAQLQIFVEERERLFQDMHDGCMHSIYAVGLNLEACLMLFEANPKKARQMIVDATASLNLVLQELRSFITGHRLQIGVKRDLKTEIGKAALAAGNRGLKFTVDIDDDAMRSLTSEQAFHLLQIAREGISNSTRHANARTGCISLKKRQGKLRLEVRDDGRGFVAGKLENAGLGLDHIEARARKMGGRARVLSVPNQGTRIVVEFGQA
jgi:signal transduction histidine kinase